MLIVAYFFEENVVCSVQVVEGSSKKSLPRLTLEGFKIRGCIFLTQPEKNINLNHFSSSKDVKN